ncbi:phage tail tape measure protein [Pseudomonas grimontii]|uniref:phage tail tape measure protein n=1 Tax=Pseudomonas grimontii TaxID=129847 RepID=UPI0021693393|nr:phage tail tape measure protein [Pseudomonas grimontii]MCS3512526.1 TP901 family phage tail tape measure protein [Pseudomonas grimontii]
MADKFQLKALITGVDKLSPMLGTIRKNAMGLRKQLNSSGLGKITFMDAVQGGAMAAPFVMGVKAAIGFESAMADVKKVVNFETPQQFKDMSQDVRNLSKELPMSAEGIAAIVAAGGQSGIAREELNAFAQDAVKMGIAFDTTAEESGSMMAKWRTAFKLNQAEVVGLADKINELGNTGAASVGQISKIVTAIGPLGEIAGLNAGQIAAMASSLAGVGIAEDVAATGMKNFALTLTAGTAATKSQKDAFKALRLDSAAIAKGMSVDSEGTINKVLKSIGKVEKSKQAAVLTQLFGKESVGAIAPLLTNLDTLQKNFALVNNEQKYGGSMQREYASRSATTANALQLMQNRVTDLGISVGNALLPPLNDFLGVVGPIISQVSDLAAANPVLIQTLIGAAVGFTALRLVTLSATVAMGLMNAVATMSPIGLVVRGIAIAAGLLMANWSTVAPYFQAIWEKIKGPAMALWAWIKNAFSYTPLAQVIENWGPLTEFFAATWELVKALSVPFFDFMKSAFDFSPLGLIIKHWAPITAWFQSLWETIKPIIEPILKFMGGGEGGPGIIKTATDKAKTWAEEQRERNAGAGGGTGAFVQANAVGQAINTQAARNASMGGLDAKSLLRAPGAPSINQQAAANQRNNLEGSLLIKMEGAPPGTRVEGSTNQPGLKVDSQLGTRTLSR